MPQKTVPKSLENMYNKSKYTLKTQASGNYFELQMTKI